MAEPEFTTEELATEEFRAVVGYEGIYSVSNLGRVRRDAPNHSGILKPHMDSDGHYYGISLAKDGRRKYFAVHQLVAAAFIGICPPGKEVNHKDAVKTNNRPGNLEYLTHLENVRHAVERFNEHWMATRARGERHFTRTRPDRIARGPRPNGNYAKGRRNGKYTHPERTPKGEQHGMARLNEQQIKDIRSRYKRGMGPALAKEFGLCRKHVCRIAHGKYWSHL